MVNDTHARQSFDEVAELYNEVRPTYPDELYAALIKATAVSRRSELLEIGPGTGQATRSMARFGFGITGVEFGGSLAGIARMNLRHYRNVRILTGSFEEIVLPAGSFDLVLAATSWHWIDPAVRELKSHRLLKSGGHLAVIQTNHVSDEKGDQFLTTAQPIYERYNFIGKGQAPVIPRHQDLGPEIFDPTLFEPQYFGAFPIVIVYSAKSFSKLLNTFSNHLAAPPRIRDRFFTEIEELINDKFSGEIEKHYSMSLTIVRKRG